MERFSTGRRSWNKSHETCRDLKRDLDSVFRSPEVPSKPRPLPVGVGRFGFSTPVILTLVRKRGRQVQKFNAQVHVTNRSRVIRSENTFEGICGPEFRKKLWRILYESWTWLPLTSKGNQYERKKKWSSLNRKSTLKKVKFSRPRSHFRNP